MSETKAPDALPVAEVKAASAAMLQMQLYAVTTIPTNGLGPVLAGLEEHLAFQVALEREGVLFAAGPLWSDDQTEWRGEGLVILRAESRAAAIAIAERDPMHASGARRFAVRPWMINEGSLGIRLDLSSRRLTLT
ncbi:YciI family protein [Salinarimonas sp. NSM]|uniref:YciI family protein n=1 Tax=Salinarimonas sp. NSM TaxID=3458003 RepID=UPI004036AEFF